MQLVATIQLHGRVAFLPLTPVALKCLKPNETDCEPQTLGQHIKKRRLELRLTQKGAAARIGVTAGTIFNWENEVGRPRIEHSPAIRDFLGYDPIPGSPGTIAERLRDSRRRLGWSQARAAREAKVHPSTWSSWEARGTIMAKAHRALVARFVGLPEQEIYDLMRQRWSESHGRQTSGK